MSPTRVCQLPSWDRMTPIAVSSHFNGRNIASVTFLDNCAFAFVESGSSGATIKLCKINRENNRISFDEPGLISSGNATTTTTKSCLGVFGIQQDIPSILQGFVGLEFSLDGSHLIESHGREISEFCCYVERIEDLVSLFLLASVHLFCLFPPLTFPQKLYQNDRRLPPTFCWWWSSLA